MPLYALTNWSHETFPIALGRYDFLGWFDAIVVSGQERIIKPDPRLYRLLLERYGLRAAELVYVDDKALNAAAATALGMHGIRFTSPDGLRAECRVAAALLRRAAAHMKGHDRTLDSHVAAINVVCGARDERSTVGA